MNVDVHDATTSLTSPEGIGLAEVLESIADPIVAFDKEWRYTFVSRRAARVLGKTPKEMLGKSMWGSTGRRNLCRIRARPRLDLLLHPTENAANHPLN